MAMNLVEQQNVLRDLTDDMLQQAMQGGIAPPYLVLAEVNRRKDARERYAAQKAKYDANQATVAQDVMQQLAQATQAAQGAAPAAPMGIAGAVGAPEMPVSSGGLDAAMPSEAPAFADGGPVMKYANGMSVINPAIQSMLMGGQSASPTPTTGFGLTPVGSMPAAPAQQGNSLLGFKFNYPTYNNPYASLMDLYQSQLGDLTKEREQARAMALIAAGTGMMQGGPNTLKNIGAAFGPALQGYQSNISSINQTQRDMLREQANLQAQAAAGEAQSKKDFADSMEGRAQLAEQLGLKPGTSEYENYVVGNRLDSMAKGEMKNVVDEVGNIKTAVVRNNKFYDPTTGTEMADVRLLDDVTKAKKIAEGKGQLTDERLFKSAALGLQADKRDYENAVEKINRTKEFLADNWYSVGDFKSLMKLPGSPARELEGMLTSIESGAVTNLLQSLRSASAKLGQAGTGFGSLTEKELDILKKYMGNLSDANDPETIEKNLDIVAAQYAKMLAASEQDFQFAYETMIKNAAETGDDSVLKKFLVENNFTDFETPRESRYLKPGGSSLLTPDLGLGSKDEYTQ